MKKVLSTIGVSAGTIALLAVGVGLGSAVAAGPNEPASVSPAYQVNDSGQTYGVIGEGAEPDLIGVYATNGKQGYVLKSELDAASGHPSQFKSPEEALAWQEEFGYDDRSIPVYEPDGKTVIGEFVITGIDNQRTEIAD